MAESPATDPAAQPLSCFTPKRLLVMFCIINMINNVDQGAIASNGVNGSLKMCTDSGICTPGSGIQGDFNLNNFQDGVLSSAFVVGLLVASPIFASLAKSRNPFRLIGIGLLLWTFATAGCGISFSFWSIAICRMLVGVGEASFISLAAPFIDDVAPAAQKNAWLAMFYMCIPTGMALGYVYGGLVGNYLNWRCAFGVEAILMLPFAVLGLVTKPLQLKDGEFNDSSTSENASAFLNYDVVYHERMQDQEASCELSTTTSKLQGVFHIRSHFYRFSKDTMALFSEEVYTINTLGNICYSFVLGAYSYWGPKAGCNIFHVTNADMLFGVITIVCGILGTLSGGYILDCMGATTSNAFKLLSGATLLGAIFCFAAFCFRSLNVFILLFAVGELLFFAPQAPVNYVCLHSVKPSLRPLSMAITTISIHVFGDVPSPPLVGLLQDYVDNWRETTLILTSVLFLAAGIWFIGVFLNGVDRYNKDGLSAIGIKEACAEPLLEVGNETRNPEP